MREWRLDRSESVYQHKILDLERHYVSAGEEHREVLVVEAPDWINVIPILPNGDVVLIRQWRFGVRALTLEIPGGMVDPGETHRQAAARELVEETGYRAGTLRKLGTTHPNPAFISNEITTWLATDLEALDVEREIHGVHGEEIRCETAPLPNIPELISSGQITHSLVVSAFYLLDHEAVA